MCETIYVTPTTVRGLKDRAFVIKINRLFHYWQQPGARRGCETVEVMPSLPWRVPVLLLVLAARRVRPTTGRLSASSQYSAQYHEFHANTDLISGFA